MLGPIEPLREGDSANLTCKITEGLPEPQLSFFKNGDPLSKERTSSLLLTNVTDSDEGKYTCEAQNTGGYFTDSIHIRVESKLIIIVVNSKYQLSRASYSFVLVVPKY